MFPSRRIVQIVLIQAICLTVSVVPRQCAVSAETFADLARDALSNRPPLEKAEFQAFLANWDNEPSADGLIVRVSTFDIFGNLTAVRGSIEVTLAFVENAGRPSAKDKHILLAKWTRRLSAVDTGLLAQEFRLPLDVKISRLPTDLRVSMRLDATGEDPFTVTQVPLAIEIEPNADASWLDYAE